MHRKVQNKARKKYQKKVHKNRTKSAKKKSVPVVPHKAVAEVSKIGNL